MATIYDFSRPRVRKDGKSLDKYSLARELDSICPSMRWTVIYDVFSYSELRSWLIKCLVRPELCKI